MCGRIPQVSLSVPPEPNTDYFTKKEERKSDHMILISCPIICDLNRFVGTNII